MNRIIKFRCWRKSFLTGKFEMIGMDSIKNWHVIDLDVKGEVVMQFTSLTDKNGKEIYEGDIVAWSEYGATYIDEPPTVKGFIKFAEGSWQTFGAVFDKVPLDTQRGINMMGSSWPGQRHFQVIGNIYENPELLECCENCGNDSDGVSNLLMCGNTQCRCHTGCKCVAIGDGEKSYIKECDLHKPIIKSDHCEMYNHKECFIQKSCICKCHKTEPVCSDPKAQKEYERIKSLGCKHCPGGISNCPNCPNCHEIPKGDMDFRCDKSN